jgi:predicted nucleic acid-binding protein
MKAYLDSCIVIYFLEHRGPLGLATSLLLNKVVSAGYQLVISDLVELECKVLPIRSKDPVQLGAIDSFCSQTGMEQIRLDHKTFLRAAGIRARYGFKLGDALHLAAAAENGCSLFLTNDQRLSACSDIPVESLTL